MSVLKGFVKKSTYPRYLKKLKLKEYSTAVEAKSEEQTNASYPKIIDVSRVAKERRTREAYYEKIKKLNTVEEKLIALNIARYYGWPSFHLKEGTIPYDFLPFTQFVTRTELQEVSELPVYLDNEHTRKLLAAVKPELEKVIVFEKYAKKFQHEVKTVLLEEDELSELQKKNIKTNSMIFQINEALTCILRDQCPHLLKTQLDYEPRLEAFWRVGGFYPTKEDKKLRKEKEYDETRLDEYIDRFIQYFGSPILQLRSIEPLPELKIDESQIETPSLNNVEVFLDESTDLAPMELIKHETKNLKKFPLQEYRYDPKTYLQIPRERIRGAVVPGFWPNDPHRFGILSYHNSNFMSERSFDDPEESPEALHCQAILASYAWVYGLACYHGFSTYYDITYPITTQTIVTDGKMFSFYQYQLNTTVLHSDGTSPENPLKNMCYGTLAEELYHDINGNSITGWNDKALLHLISMYTNAPKERVGVDLNPYLNKDEWLIAHIKDDKKRIWLHNQYQKITSHRPNYRPDPEIYDWERIYKIENKRRVMDARKRFFEKFQDPINDRKLFEVKVYVPKKFRDPAKPKKKLLEFYYPDAYQNYHDIV